MCHGCSQFTSGCLREILLACEASLLAEGITYLAAVDEAAGNLDIEVGVVAELPYLIQLVCRLEFKHGPKARLVEVLDETEKLNDHEASVEFRIAE